MLSNFYMKATIRKNKNWKRILSNDSLNCFVDLSESRRCRSWEILHYTSLKFVVEEKNQTSRHSFLYFLQRNSISMISLTFKLRRFLPSLTLRLTPMSVFLLSHRLWMRSPHWITLFIVWSTLPDFTFHRHRNASPMNSQLSKIQKSSQVQEDNS